MNTYTQLMVEVETLSRRYVAAMATEGLMGDAALIVLRLGDRTMRVGDLRLSGIYTGSNVAYNLDKLSQRGLIRRDPSEDDMRVVLVSLTERGRELADRLRAREAFLLPRDLSPDRGYGDLLTQAAVAVRRLTRAVERGETR